MDYRKEIDGLRALAVVPVILFHAGFETFSGGFVGVDVFFVISGYLITTIILAELEQKKFSIVNFYERRARRILPALFLVMLICIPFAWLWFPPSDMKDFSQSLIAVSAFASNILFWRESGYFDTAAELKPMLHTWSLAVEEQYYVIFPLFLMLFWRLGKRWTIITLTLAFFASLGLAEWETHKNPSAAFFLLPARGWELLIGAFTAFYLSQANRKNFGKIPSEAGGWLGIALVLYAIFTFSKTTPFPGIHALVPTMGAALIILFATQNTTAGKFIGNKAFVGIGLISYSAYLWHQPLFVFARHRMLLEPSQAAYGILSILALILAYLSWKFIEAPFKNKLLINRGFIFSLFIVGSSLFISFGLYGQLTEGKLAGRTAALHTDIIENRLRTNHGLGIECEGNFNSSPNCTTSPQPEVLLWGDSYAMHLAPGFISSNPSIRMIQKTASQCGPFLGISRLIPSNGKLWSEKCLSINKKVFEYLKSTPSIKYVAMSSPFSGYVNEDATVLTEDGRVLQGKNVALYYMRDTITKLRQIGKTPVIFSPPPQNSKNIGRCLLKASLFHENKKLCDFPLSDATEHQANVWRFLKEISKDVKVVNFSDYLCDKIICRASLGEVFIYRDDGHLSYEGSSYLGAKMNFYQTLTTPTQLIK